MSYKTDIAIISSYLDYTDYSDIIKSKFNFECVKDCLCKDGVISEKTYNNAYLHIDKKHHKTYILCGCYKLRIE